MKKKLFLVAIGCFLLGAIVYSSSIFVVNKTMSLKRPKLSTQLPGGYDSASIAELYELGFHNAKDLEIVDVLEQRKYYQKYGLLFMSESEVKELLSANNFIMGDADKYIGSVPSFALATIKEKLNELDDHRSIWNLRLTHENRNFELFSDNLKQVPTNGYTDWYSYMSEGFAPFVKESAVRKYNIPRSPFWQLSLLKPSNQRIMIIGGAKDFNISGMQVVEGILSLPVPKDPMALLKVPGGYVELVNWE